MSLMKKYIISCLLFYFVIFLTSCNKDIKTYVYQEDYNLLNENLEIPVYTNVFNSPYMDINNVANVYLKDEENTFLIELLRIDFIEEENDLFCYKYIFDMSLFSDEYLVLIKPSLVIEYINQKEVTYKLNSLCVYNTTLSNDLSLVYMKGIYDSYLKGVVFSLKNNTQNNIKISDLKLINANFGADLANLKVIDREFDDYNSLLESYDPYNIATSFDQNITLEEGVTITLFIPICYKTTTVGNQSAFLVSYYIDNVLYHKGIHNFLFYTNDDAILGEYNVSN